MPDLSTKQAAGRLGISVPTVIAWITNGRLEGSRVMNGRRSVWRCTEASVEKVRQVRAVATPDDMEQRMAAVEAFLTPTARPATARILRDWIAAEDMAARRRRQVIQLLTGSAVTE